MKVLCEACGRLLDLTVFRFDGGSLVIACTGCGVEHRAEGEVPLPPPSVPPLVPKERVPVPSTSPFASNVVALRDIGAEAAARAAKSIGERPFDAPSGRCPKCIASRIPADPSCRQCGLVFSQLDDAALSPSDWLRDQWLSLLARWSDTGAHDTIISQGMLRGELPAMGRLYRIRLADMPDDPLARRGRDEVLRHAGITAPTGDTGYAPETKSPAQLKRVALIALVVSLTAAAFLVLRYFAAPT